MPPTLLRQEAGTPGSVGSPRPISRAILECLSAFLTIAAVGAPVAWADGRQAVTARFQQATTESARDVVVVSGRSIHASPSLVYLNGQASSLAYSLDPRVAPAVGTTWHAVAVATPGLRGVATALWAGGGHLPGPALSDNQLEGAARQIAIWTKGGTIRISRATVHDPRVRARASFLATAAPNQLKGVPPQPNALEIASFVQRVDADRVVVAVNVSDDLEDTFTDEQKIDLRAGGRWAVIKTGEQTDVYQNGKGTRLPTRRSGTAPDHNTALLRLDRTADVTQLELFWGVNLAAGVALLPDGAGPPLITATPVVLRIRQLQILDPATYPSARDLVDRAGTAVLARLHGWVGWVVLVFALWLVPKLGQALDVLVKQLVKRLRRPSHGPGPSPPDNTPSGPPPKAQPPGVDATSQ